MILLLTLLSCSLHPPPVATPTPVVEAASVAQAAPGLTLADLAFSGDPAVAAASREVSALLLRMHPSVTADAGLLGDGLEPLSALLIAHTDTSAWGEAFSERAFHDALLAEGPIPVSLARQALLAAGPHH